MSLSHGNNHFCNDDFWDLNVTWYTNLPDFTQCFREIIFAVVPCFIFTLIGVIKLCINFKHPMNEKLMWTSLRISKMVLCAILILINIIRLSFFIHQFSSDIDTPGVLVGSSCMEILCYVVILLTLKQDQRVGIRSSTYHSIFWFLFFICDIVRYRSSIIKVFTDQIYTLSSVDFYVLDMVHFPIVFCQFFLALFHDPNNWNSMERSFLADSSFFSMVTFFWVYKYIYKSTKKLLTVNDFQPLSKKLTAKYLYPRFELRWKNALRKKGEDHRVGEKNKPSTFTLTWVLLKSAWPYLLYGCICQIIYDFLIFVPAILLDKLITFMSSDEYAWRGYFYCASLVICDFVAQSIFNFALFFCVLFANQMKTLTTAAIYRKALRLSNSSKKQYTSGEIVNLMSVDVQNVYDFCFTSTFLLAGPIKMIITLVMLWQYLGPSCLAGGGVLVIMIIYGYVIARKIDVVQEKQMKMKDFRLKHMGEILNGIKVLKLYAWEIPFMKKISDIRQKEVKFLKQFQLLYAASCFVWDCGPFFVAIACLVTYVMIDETHVLKAATLFVSLNLLNILRHCVLEIPYMVSKIVQTKVSLTRMTKFLTTDEHIFNAVGNDCSSDEVISLKNGTFAWSNDGEPILRDINLRVPHGSLVAIVGPVGSGKSSLLSAMLGEMDKISGFVNVKGSLAYVPQQAWILNKTVKDNIIFVSPMPSKSKYNEVLEGCCLKPDLKILPGGDKTEIGEKGVNLSGGQKQRISLARAVYHNADIYLFDDPLSAVDSHVGKHIFEHIIGHNGLLKHKTRVLVTHNINVLPDVDFIITVKDGKIEETGTYHALLERGGAFAEFMAEHATGNETDDEEENTISATIDLAPDNQSINSKLLRHLSVDSSSSAKLIDEENMEIGEVKRAIYVNYVKHLSIYFFLGIIIGLLSTEAFEIGINFWLSEWAMDPTLPDGSQDHDKRNFRIAIYAVLGVCKVIVKVISSICLAYGAARSAKLYHKEMMESIMRSPMSFFDTTPIGRILNRFGSDIDAIDKELSVQLDNSVGCLSAVLAMVVVVGINTPIFLATLIPIVIIYYIFQKYYINASRQMKRLSSTTKSPIFSSFTETLSGVSSIRAYDVEDHFVKAVDNHQDTHIKTFMYWSMSNRWLKFHLTLVGDCIVLIVCLLIVNSKGVIEAAVAGLSLTYALATTEVLTWLVYCATDLENKFVSVERVEEYSNLPSEAPWIVSESFPPSSWPTKGTIQFRNYSTRYRKELDLVIKKIDLQVKENERVGIVGRTGAGKSSITLALFRIIESVEGTALIDNIDISKIGLHQLRSKLTIIPQDPVLFTGPLRMNLDPNNTSADNELWSSLESANLKEFVSSQSDGLNFEIAEGGENLSVGQRQLVCLARALLKRAKILVLDEATAAVDMETDRLIQNTIRTEFKNYTVITIAHRLNTIMDYDKVVVMDAGKIVEFGKPSELVKDSDSFFYKMADDAGIL